MALAIMPSSASISLTKWPFPKPPMAGLHDISPTVSIFIVIKTVLAPILEEADAASTPACPPPITMTSKFFVLFVKTYLPIQKLLNISSKISSTSMTLVILPISFATILKFSEAISGLVLRSNLCNSFK